MVSDPPLGNLNVRGRVAESQEQRNSETQWKQTVLAPAAEESHVVPEAWLWTTRESLELSEVELWQDSHKL